MKEVTEETENSGRNKVGSVQQGADEIKLLK